MPNPFIKYISKRLDSCNMFIIRSKVSINSKSHFQTNKNLIIVQMNNLLTMVGGALNSLGQGAMRQYGIALCTSNTNP